MDYTTRMKELARSRQDAEDAELRRQAFEIHRENSPDEYTRLASDAEASYGAYMERLHGTE